MDAGKKSTLICPLGALALGAVLAGCARSNPAGVAANPAGVAAPTPVSTQPAKAKVAAADGMPEVVVGASRADEAEIVVKAARDNPNIVALSEHKAH